MYPQGPGQPQGDPPPNFYPQRRPTPWWLVLIYIFGGLAAVSVLGVVAFIGLIAFVCGHH